MVSRSAGAKPEKQAGGGAPPPSRDASSAAPVLVVGAGLHAQATSNPLGWPELLTQTFRGSPIAGPFNHALALGWEGHVIGGISPEDKKAAAKAENAALAKVACGLDTRYPIGADAPLYQQIRDARIADLVVFNFDRSLHPATTVDAWSDPRRGPSIGRTRVWYPHGHTGQHKHIVLGTRRFGLEITALEKERGKYWSALHEHPRPRREPVPTHWLHTFLGRREVHLIGLGLRPEEWTIWWALTQRARRFAKTPAAQRPRTIAHVFRRGAEAVDPWLAEACVAVGVHLVNFERQESSAKWTHAIDSAAQKRGGGR